MGEIKIKTHALISALPCQIQPYLLVFHTHHNLKFSVLNPSGLPKGYLSYVFLSYIIHLSLSLLYNIITLPFYLTCLLQDVVFLKFYSFAQKSYLGTVCDLLDNQSNKSPQGPPSAYPETAQIQDSCLENSEKEPPPRSLF